MLTLISIGLSLATFALLWRTHKKVSGLVTYAEELEKDEGDL